MPTENTSYTKPFLRWAGGKTWLIKHLDKIIGNQVFNNYHEPFLGGGAVFFYLSPVKLAFLSDLNSELIETYRAIKDSPGIYRVNTKGEYNVPYGNRTKPFLEEDKLVAASSKLQNVILQSGDFECIKRNIATGDLIFLDPPYTVSHNNNGFIKYNQKLFSLDDQYRLRTLIDFIKQKGAYYILTNAAHQTIFEIFHQETDVYYELSRASLIGGENAVRGQIKEYIFTNIQGGLKE